MALMSVRQRQLNLFHVGYYYTGAIDNIAGWQTKRAYIVFQRAVGITVDGIWGPQSDGASRDEVRKVQRLLNKHGYNLAVDGLVGPLTIGAIKDYQRKNGLMVDGIVGIRTMAALLGTPLKPATTPSGTVYNVAPTGKNTRPIIINAGHGGHDPGAVGNGLQEKDLNLKVAWAVYETLTAAGYKCLMTRTDDRYMSLASRVNFAKRHNAILYMSVHHNAGGGKGAEVVVHKSEPPGSMKLARMIRAEFEKLGQNWRRINLKNDYEVRETPMSANISEYAFLDNAADVQMVNSDEKLKKEAEAIARAIERWL